MTNDVGNFIKSSDSLYIKTINKSNRKQLKYVTNNIYRPPSSIYSSNMYYSKNSNRTSYLLFDQSSEEELPNYYLLGGGKYIFIPENKEIVKEKKYTNWLVGTGLISIAILKILIL